MKKSPNIFGRRQFLQKAGIGLAGLIASACQPIVIYIPSLKLAQPSPSQAPTASSQPSPLPATPTSTVCPSPSPTFLPTQLSILVSEEEKAFLAEHEIQEGDTSRPVVMLTYDDNAKYAQVREILDALYRHHAKASFFFIGEKMQLSAKAVRAIVAEGHLLGCHSWEHISLQPLSDDQVNRQFSRCFDALNEVVPGYRMRFIRFPFGDGTSHPRLLRIAANWGLQHVCWTMGSGGLDSQTYNNVMRNVENGSIILSHMFRPYDVSQADRIIGGLIDKGYSLETVETGRKKEDIFPG